MTSIQAKLIANFGPFIDTIITNVKAQDYHVMAIDSDACGDGGFGPMGECAMYPGCGQTLGAGEVRNCGIADPPRFITSALAPAQIKSQFECAANVGAKGSSLELTFSAVEQAVTTQNAPGGCNPGFVRYDAVLVVVVITDEHTGWAGGDNANTVGTPQQWHDAILAAKGNIPDHVVVLGLIPTRDGPDDCLGFWSDGNSDRFIEFMNLWGAQGIMASVCEPDYAPFFQQAVNLIDSVCDEYIPPPE